MHLLQAGDPARNTNALVLQYAGPTVSNDEFDASFSCLLDDSRPPSQHATGM